MEKHFFEVVVVVELKVVHVVVEEVVDIIDVDEVVQELTDYT